MTSKEKAKFKEFNIKYSKFHDDSHDAFTRLQTLCRVNRLNVWCSAAQNLAEMLSSSSVSEKSKDEAIKYYTNYVAASSKFNALRELLEIF